MLNAQQPLFTKCFEELREKTCACYSAVGEFLKIYQKFNNYVNKKLDEVDDEIVYNALIGGLKSDGTFSENSIAYFVRDFVGVAIEDPKIAASAISHGIRPPTKILSLRNARGVSYSEIQAMEQFLSEVRTLRRVVEYTIRELGGCEGGSPPPVELSGIPQAVQELFDKCVLEFLPQYNSCVQLAFHTAQNTYRYLKALSSTNQFRGLLENKKLVDMLGLTEILDAGMGEDFKLWGYPDCLVYDKEVYVRCLNMENVQTLGGALNRLALLSKRLLTVMGNKWRKWFNIDGLAIERQYASELCTRVQLADFVRSVAGYKYETRGWGDPCIRYTTQDEYKVADLTRATRGECITDRGHVYFPSFGIVESYDIKDDFVILVETKLVEMKLDYSLSKGPVYYPVYSRESKPIYLKEFLARVEPLMFTRVLNPVFITGDGKIQRVFLTTSYPREILCERAEQ